jgi:magnesium transporter
MTAMDSDTRLRATLGEVTTLLERHRVLETWTRNQAVGRQREIVEALQHRQNLADLHNRLRAVHAADIAYILEALPVEDRTLVWQQVPESRAGSVLPELRPAVREDLMAGMSPHALVAVLAGMDAADLAYVSESVPPLVLDEVYRARGASERSWIETVASYPEDSAGRLMVQDYVAVPDSRAAGDVLAQIRARGQLSRHLDAFFVVDVRNVLRGVVPMRALLVHDPARPVVDLMTPEAVVLRPSDKLASAADAFARYDLVCAPVVDERGKLLGALAVDAVLDSVSAQATKDIQKMGGLEALDAPYDQVPFWAMVRKRGGWLSALFFGEMLTATAMGHYESEIARAVVLALFVPLIISSGGNSGSQAASLIIRALALKELGLPDWLRVFRRELLSGLTLGAALGAIGFVRIILWQGLDFTDYGPHFMSIAAIVCFSLVGVVCFGTLAGSMLPFLLHALRFDPATSSAPFVATLVDVTGLIIYFQVAAVILRGALA